MTRLFTWLGISNDPDAPAFSKIIVITLLFAVCASRELDHWYAAMFIGASFGRSTFIAFLHRNTFKRTDANTGITTTVRGTRLADEGVELTP